MSSFFGSSIYVGVIWPHSRASCRSVLSRFHTAVRGVDVPSAACAANDEEVVVSIWGRTNSPAGNVLVRAFCPTSVSVSA